MKILNKTKIPNRVLRRATSWAAKEAGFAPSLIASVKAKVSFRPGGILEFHGTCNTAEVQGKRVYEIVVHANPDQDTIENSLSGLLWWVATIRWYDRCKKWPAAYCARATHKRLKNAVNAEILRDWAAPDKRESVPKITVGEFAAPELLSKLLTNGKAKKTRKQVNAEKAEKHLKNWERKLAMAKTKVRKYKQQVARYKREGLLNDD